MSTTADFSVAGDFAVYRDPHQLAGVIGVEGFLEKTRFRRHRFQDRALTHQLQDRLDRLADGFEAGQPSGEVTGALLGRLLQPEMERRQVKVTGTAGNRRALLNAAQELVGFQVGRYGTTVLV
jgi:hypothetical protein